MHALHANIAPFYTRGLSILYILVSSRDLGTCPHRFWGDNFIQKGRGEREERREDEKGWERGRRERKKRWERRKLYGFLFPTSNHKAELMVGWAPYVPPLYGSSRSEEGKHIHLSGPKEPVKAITTTVLASNSLYYGLEDPLTPNYHLRKEALRSQSYFPGKTGRANKDKNREWGSCLPRLFMTCFSASFWASAHLFHSEEVYF